MSQKTTVLLLLLCGAMFGAWALFFRDQANDSTLTKTPVFGGLISEEVASISLSDPIGTRLTAPITLRPKGGNEWSLECPSIDNGRPVRARKEAVFDLLQAVRELIPIAVLSESVRTEELEGYGLSESQRQTIVIERLGGSKIEAAFGADQGAGQVVFHRFDRPHVFGVAREARNLIFTSLERYEDQAFLSVPFLDVIAMSFESQGRLLVELERRFDRWWVTKPAEVLADDRAADEIRNHLLDIRVLKRVHDASANASLDAGRIWKVSLRVRGREQPLVLHFGAPTEGGVPARIEGESAVKMLHPGILPILERTRGDLRDPHLLTLPRSEIASFELVRPGQPKLVLNRQGDAYFLEVALSDGKLALAREADPTAVDRFLEQLGSLTLSGYVLNAPTFEPAVSVRVTRRDGQAPVAIQIGADVKDGRVPARVVGEAGSGTVDSAATAFLDAPYWTLLSRLNRGTDAYFKIGRIRIEDDQGLKLELKCRIERAQADLKAKVSLGKEPDLEVPEAMLHPAKNKIVDFTIRDFVGDRDAPEMGLESPRLKVSWFEPEGASISGIPESATGRWGELRVGSKRPDGLSFARMNDDLGLVFLLEHADLANFYRLLEEFGTK